MDQDRDDTERDPYEEQRPGFWRRNGALVAAWIVLLAALGGLIAWLALTPATAPPSPRIAIAPPPAPAMPPAAGEVSAAEPPAPAEEAPAGRAAPPATATARGPEPAGEATPSPQGPAAPARTSEAAPAPAPTPPTTGAGAPKPDPPAAAPRDTGRVALAPAPDPALVDRTPIGPLPVIGPDGRAPWQVYARPFEADATTPRIAIVLGGLGYSRSATSAAIQRLDGSITLAFAPYAQRLQDWITEARAAGHEVMLQLPMEPFDYPDNDPGPHTLLTSLTERENLTRLEWLLGRFTGYVGVTNMMGAKFTTSATHLEPVMKALKERGLMFLDSRVTAQSVAARVARREDVPRALNNRFIDAAASRTAIDAQLSELERIAQLTGSAVGIGYAYPVTIERLANWTPTLRLKGIALAPASALANRQKIP